MYSLILIHIHLRILFIWMAIRRRSLRIGCPRIIPRTKGIRILIANPPLPRASDKRYSSCLYWWIASMPQAMAKRVRAMKAPHRIPYFLFHPISFSISMSSSILFRLLYRLRKLGKWKGSLGRWQIKNITSREAIIPFKFKVCCQNGLRV